MDSIKRYIDKKLSSATVCQVIKWLIMFIIFLVALFLLSWFLNADVAPENFILHFINPANFLPNEITYAQKTWALVIGFLGALFLGTFIPFITNFITQRVENLQNGLVSYSFNNHYIIIGYDEMMADIIKQIYEREEKINIDIIVQTDKVKDARRRLKAELDEKIFKQVVFIYGASDSEEDLRKLHVQNAKRIIILGDDKTEAHDNLNMKCLEKVAMIRNKSSKERIDCDVLFSNLSTYKILQEISIDENLCKKIYFRPFNFIEDNEQQGMLSSINCANGTIALPFLMVDADIINWDMKAKSCETKAGGHIYLWYKTPFPLIRKLVSNGIQDYSVFLQSFIKKHKVLEMPIKDMWDVDTPEAVKQTENILRSRANLR